LLAQMRPKIIIEPHMVGETLTTERCRQILEEIGGYKVRLMDQLGVSLPLITATPVSA
jgi:hypothetical protein